MEEQYKEKKRKPSHKGRGCGTARPRSVQYRRGQHYFATAGCDTHRPAPKHIVYIRPVQIVYIYISCHRFVTKASGKRGELASRFFSLCVFFSFSVRVTYSFYSHFFSAGLGPVANNTAILAFMDEDGPMAKSGHADSRPLLPELQWYLINISRLNAGENAIKCLFFLLNLGGVSNAVKKQCRNIDTWWQPNTRHNRIQKKIWKDHLYV